MCEKRFVQIKNSSNRSLFSVMEKDLIFNWAILKIFVNFAQKIFMMRGFGSEKSPDFHCTTHYLLSSASSLGRESFDSCCSCSCCTSEYRAIVPPGERRIFWNLSGCRRCFLLTFDRISGFSHPSCFRSSLCTLCVVTPSKAPSPPKTHS